MKFFCTLNLNFNNSFLESEKINQKLAKIDQKLAKIDQKLAKIDQKLAKIDQKLAKIDQKLPKLRLFVWQPLSSDRTSSLLRLGLPESPNS